MVRLCSALILFLAALTGAGSPCFGATRRAVLIGINQYNPEGGQVSTGPAKKSPTRKGLVSGDVRRWTYPNLEGAINDVNLIEGLLLAPDFGFQPNDIVKLITPEKTTAEEILATLRRELVETADKGDFRLVYYSGHGNFIRNAALKRANANTRNEFDQTIVASDQWQGAVDVRDKELSQILWDSARKGVVVTFIADSCHSGSLTRGPANSRGRSRSNSGVRSGVDGVTFDEPLIDDPAPIDKATGKEIDPENAGVLTLAAAQENQEALELRSEKNETHGGMTMALVRAIREEGPHASMDHIFERMSNYMQAANLQQTPVLGGKGRGDKDLLGEPARQEPFSVIVREVRGDEVLLRGGEAIGLNEGAELRSLAAGTASQPATLVVTKSLGLSEAAAKISSPGAAVAAGDRFEVTRWAAPEEPNLKVYIAPPAAIETTRQAAEQMAPLRDDPSIHWVADPTVESPSDVLRWNSDRWVLDHIGSGAKTFDLGPSPSAADVKKNLAKGARFFVLMPPTPEISAAITLGEGTRYPGIQRLKGSDSSNADYRLYGRLTSAGIQYAWLQADADLGSRETSRVSTRSSPPAAKTNRPTAIPAAVSPLPNRTDWLDGKAEGVGAMLTEYAVRIGKVRAWLTLSGQPGQTAFPYSLVLRKPGSDANARAGVLYGGEQYKLFLQLDPKYKGTTTARRWVYVFAISQQGKGTLLFPRLDSGNEGNHLPRAEKDEKPTAPAVPLIGLLDEPYDLEIAEPWGTDTYVVISTKDAIPNPNTLDFDGVQSTRGAQPQGSSGSPLQDLLDSCGNSTRGAYAAKAPSEWSIERITFQSAKKK
jgi:hypothetical protein